MAGAAEGPGGAGVTVLRLWAATSQTPHLTVRPIHHLYELSHPEDAREGGREGGKEGERIKGRKEERNTEAKRGWKSTQKQAKATRTTEGREGN